MSDCDFGVQATVVTRQRLPKPACKPSEKGYTQLQGGHYYGINAPLAYVDAAANTMRPFVKGDAKVHAIRTCPVDLTDTPETEFCELGVCLPSCCNKDVPGIDVGWPEGMKDADVEALNTTARVAGDCCAFNFIDIPCNTHSTLPCLDTTETEGLKQVTV